MLNILVTPGDGIGPEITAAKRTVVHVFATQYKLDIELTDADCGMVS